MVAAKKAYLDWGVWADGRGVNLPLMGEVSVASDASRRKNDTLSPMPTPQRAYKKRG